MNVNLGTYSDADIALLVREIERVFELIPEPARLSYDVTLDFAAPAGVPGFTDEVVAIEGVELGDTVLVGAPVAAGANFLPPVGFVSAADEVTVRWMQISGAAADPDGSGGTYRIDVWRH